MLYYKMHYEAFNNLVLKVTLFHQSKCLNHLQKNIDQFHELIAVYDICNAIDGIHISLVDLPNKKMTLVMTNFFNIFFHNIVM